MENLYCQKGMENVNSNCIHYGREKPFETLIFLIFMFEINFDIKIVYSSLYV